MRGFVRGFGAAFVVAAIAASARAHGGTYNPAAPPADPGPPLGPPWHPPHIKDAEPELTPGGGDPKVAVTRWETWWASNKEAYLRLAERFAGDAPGATPSARPPSERAAAAAVRRDEALRRRLAGVFIEAMKDPSLEVRTAAAIALGKTGDADASAPLRIAAKCDPEKDVRDSAVLGLGLLGRPGEIPFLEAVLFDRAEVPRRRAFAAFSLGLVGGEDAAVSLLRFVEERSGPRAPESLRKRPELAASVFVAMGLTGAQGVLPALRAAAADADFDENVRSFAFISLGRMKDRASMQAAVTTLVSERDPALRRAAAVALGRIAASSDTGAVAALVGAVRDDRDPLVRHFAATALGGIAGPKVRETLRDLFEKADDAERPFAALAVGLQRDADFAPKLRAALGAAKDESEAGSLCIALGLLGDAASAGAIEQTLDGARKIWLKGYAALSLGMIGSTSSIGGLRRRLEAEKDPRLRVNLAVALGMLHDPRSKTYLVDKLRAADTFYERGSAALALGALRCTGAALDLEAVYRDPKETEILRAFSLVALGEIADPSPLPKLTRFSIDGNYDGAAQVDPLNEVLSIY